jgi:hypothetical protein
MHKPRERHGRRTHGTPDGFRALEYGNLHSSFRKVKSTNQCVVPGSDNDDIVISHEPPNLSFAHFDYRNSYIESTHFHAVDNEAMNLLFEQSEGRKLRCGARRWRTTSNPEALAN